ncbi:MAG TPA: nuclear transport factor 2 family protein [Vicinamibacterales bacterium]|nr:nuclear transport factor 2 family protein [Vicinamibacterales bacterium]
MATEIGTTRQVFEHHLGAFAAGDLDGILSDYTDDAIVIGPDGALQGKQSIRGFFEAVLASLFKPGTYQLTMDTLHVLDDVVYIVWHAHCASANIAFAADTFLIRGGKIAVQTFAAKIEPTNQDSPSVLVT